MWEKANNEYIYTTDHNTGVYNFGPGLFDILSVIVSLIVHIGLYCCQRGGVV